VKTKYSFKKKLGCGTTSTVRLALRKSDGKEFAIKVNLKKKE
jgi:serine/threonine protein kinase